MIFFIFFFCIVIKIFSFLIHFQNIKLQKIQEYLAYNNKESFKNCYFEALINKSLYFGKKRNNKKAINTKLLTNSAKS